MSKSLDFSRDAAGASRSSGMSRGVFITMRLGLAVLFMGAGVAKLIGIPAMNDMVDQVQPGEGFRWAIGSAQVAGGGLLLLRSSRKTGAILLIVTMLVVAMLQCVVNSASALPILGLVYLCFALLFERSFN